MAKIKRKKKYHYIYLLLCIAIIITTTENYLVSRNYPLFSGHRNHLIENDRFQPLLGWTNSPNMRKTANGEEPVPGQENVDHLGRRYIGENVKNPQKRFLFLGCSYTFGMDISDEDTYLYKIAKHFPQWQFDNYAVPGYGTHQCRIMLEKLLSNPNSPKYDSVFYAFIEDHPSRIAYDFAYMPDINNNNAGIRPFAYFSWNGAIKYHNQDNEFIPGAETFRILSFVNNLYAAHKSMTSKKHENKNALYNAVLHDMLNLCKNNSTNLSVLLLENSNYRINKDLIKSGLNVYDIKLSDIEDPKYHVSNDIFKHPNSAANDYWAKQIIAILNKKYL